MKQEPSIEILLGKTLISCEVIKGYVKFVDTAGQEYWLYHEQDCCEDVSLEETVGNLEDLVGSPIVEAEKISSEGEPAPAELDDIWKDSYTWTFYKLGTQKGFVTLRFLGMSNGYYSESVDFCVGLPLNYCG